MTASKISVELNSAGEVRVKVDGELIGGFESLHLEVGSSTLRDSSLSRLQLRLPKIATDIPPELKLRLLANQDHIRALLKPLAPYVEVWSSDTLPGMAAVRLSDEDSRP